MKQINLTINNQLVVAEPGETILQAAKRIGIAIPTLCNREDLITKGNCRVCSVEVEGEARLMAACETSVIDGMRVHTDSKRVLTARKTIVEMLLSAHNRECTCCEKTKACQLQKIADDLEILDERYPLVYIEDFRKEYNALLVREPDKCIKCGRCVDVCSYMQYTYALGMLGRGYNTCADFSKKDDIDASGCIGCGKCAEACPTGAIYPNKHLTSLWLAIDDPNKFVVMYMLREAPFDLGDTAGLKEEISLPINKAIGFFKDIGIDVVLDATRAVCLCAKQREEEFYTIQESDDGEIPLLTSDNPSVFRFLEKHKNKLRGQLSMTPTPMQLMGTYIKTYYSQKLGLEPENIITVAITDDLSNKLEVDRPVTEKSMDIVLFNDEIPVLVAQTMVDLNTIKPKEFDQIFMQIPESNNKKSNIIVFNDPEEVCAWITLSTEGNDN